MYLKAKIKTEQFYWNKQIERHRIGKIIRNMARQIDKKPYKKLGEILGINRRTVWAVANGLTVVSDDLKNRIYNLNKQLQ